VLINLLVHPIRLYDFCQKIPMSQSTIGMSQSSQVTGALDTESTVSDGPHIPNGLTVNGKSKRCYVYSTEHRTIFKDWWQKTYWFHENNAKEPSAKKNIHWGSETKRSDIWDHYLEGAVVGDGSPVAICIRCDAVLTHGSSNNNGNSALIKHLDSNGRIRVATNRGLAQLTLYESIKKSLVDYCLDLP